MVWPLSGLLAHSQACGAALMGYVILAGVDPQGAQGQEGQAQLACLQWSTLGGALWHPEGDRPVGGMDPPKHSFGCLHSARKFMPGTGSLWDFGWGMGKEDGSSQSLCSLPS